MSVRTLRSKLNVPAEPESRAAAVESEAGAARSDDD
jgi:hypothetical protein